MKTRLTFSIKHFRLVACVAGGLYAVTSARAADVSWTGGGGDHDWLNPLNWSSNPSLPVEGTGTAGDVVLLDTTTDYAIFTAADGTRNYRQVRVGYNADGRLDVTGGTLNGDNNIQQRIGRGGHTGVVNISGGSLTAGHIAQVGLDNGSVGIVSVSGTGTWGMFRGATQDGVANVSLALGAGGTGQGTLNMSGGSVLTRFGVMVGQSSLLGSGTFHVMGGGVATIGGYANPGNDGFWIQRGNGTLQVTIDSLNGFSLGTINIYDSGDLASYVTFDSGSTLDLGFSGQAPAISMSWDLMTFADGITLTDSGLQLAAGEAAAGWGFDFVDAGGAPGVDTLRITYTVPEPGTFLLGGLGLLSLVFARRNPQA